MSSFDFGGPVMVQTVADETAASRENRDVAQMGVENKFTAVAGGSVRDLSSGTATTVAATATGGRENRDFGQRGGDDVLAVGADGFVTDPTTTVTTNGRNDREYVNTADGTSAITGAKDPLYDELAKGDAPTDLPNDPLS